MSSGAWAALTTINYSRMADIFPDDHYMVQPMFVDPEVHVADYWEEGPYYPSVELQEYRIETEAMFKERTGRKYE